MKPICIKCQKEVSRRENERIGRYMNRKFCSLSCWASYVRKGKKNTPEVIEKMRAKLKGKMPKNIKLIHSVESRKKQGLTMKKRFAQGLNSFPKNLKKENNPFWKGGITLDKKEYNCFAHRKRRALKNNSKGHFTRDEWNSMKQKYQYMCLCCKKQEPLVHLEPDHVVPLSRGGPNDISNIQPLCRNCNGVKWTKTIDYRIKELFI